MSERTRGGSSLEGREDGATGLLTIASTPAHVLIKMIAVIIPMGKLRQRVLLRVSW